MQIPYLFSQTFGTIPGLMKQIQTTAFTLLFCASLMSPLGAHDEHFTPNGEYAPELKSSLTEQVQSEISAQRIALGKRLANLCESIVERAQAALSNPDIEQSLHFGLHAWAERSISHFVMFEYQSPQKQTQLFIEAEKTLALAEGKTEPRTHSLEKSLAALVTQFEEKFGPTELRQKAHAERFYQRLVARTVVEFAAACAKNKMESRAPRVAPRDIPSVTARISALPRGYKEAFTSPSVYSNAIRAAGRTGVLSFIDIVVFKGEKFTQREKIISLLLPFAVGTILAWTLTGRSQPADMLSKLLSDLVTRIVLARGYADKKTTLFTVLDKLAIVLPLLLDTTGTALKKTIGTDAFIVNGNVIANLAYEGLWIGLINNVIPSIIKKYEPKALRSSDEMRDLMPKMVRDVLLEFNKAGHAQLLRKI